MPNEKARRTRSPRRRSAALPEARRAATPSPRERRRAARTNEILSRALAQVETQGLEGMTLQALADELDYSPAALYRYFPSKDALVAELQRRVVVVLDRKLARLEERISDEDALVVLAAAGLFYADLARSAPQAFGLLAVSLGDPRRLIDDTHAGAVIEAARPMFARIAAQAERAATEGRLDEGAAVDRAVTLWAATHGVVQLGKLTPIAPELLDTARLAEALIESLLVGWGAPRDEARAAVEKVRTSGLARALVTADDLARAAADELP